MLLEFSKYQGAGNDFILIDGRDREFFPSESLIKKLCDRHYGIGSDGLVVLSNSQVADYSMRIYNSDGSFAAMCGNGLRCLVLYLQERGIFQKKLVIETGSGLIDCRMDERGIQICLPIPKDLQSPRIIAGYTTYFLNTGVPHAVVVVENLQDLNLCEEALKIRHHASFGSEGTNVNFYSVKDAGTLFYRTFERGVEGETNACGTGAAAVALVHHYLQKKGTVFEVIPPSGDPLYVELQEESLYLTGSAHFIFKGIMEI